LKRFKRREFTKHDVAESLNITEQLANTYITQLRKLGKVVITVPQNIKICAKYRVASK
jgi:DNA-binding transcriptional regulator LsrR (DeoR family)